MKHKRLLSILLALALVLTLLPALPVFAATYDLYVCGIQVTDSNKDDIFSDGRAQYIPEYKQLNIRGDFASPNTIIESGIDGLLISARTHSYDTVTLTSTTQDTIVLRSNATIKGSYLELQPTSGEGQDSAIYVKGGTLTIQDSTVKANGDYTIYGMSTPGAGLKIQNSNITATCNDSTGTAIGNFKFGIELVEARITKPVGGKVDSLGTTIVTSSNTIAHEVEITAGDAYDLWLDCVQVTSANALNPLGDGTFQFYAPNTLYIKDSYSATGPVIENGIEGLKILTDGGPYTLTSAETNVIETTASLTFSYANLKLISEGPGTQDCAVYVDATGKTLTFSDCEMELSADWTVFGKFGSNNDALVIKNSDLKIDSTVTAVRNFKAGITLESCYIESPAGATYDGDSIMDGSAVAENVVIKKGTDPGVKYDLWVEGTQVTDKNKNDIVGGGFFKYDPATNVLTAKGNTHAYGTNNVVTNNIPGLTIQLAGDLTTSSPEHGFYTTTDMTVDGNGHKLTLTASSTNRGAIYISSDSGTANTLTVKNLAYGSKIAGYWGVVGDMHKEKLVIDNCQVTIDTKQAAVSDFDDGITITGWGIIAPDGAYVETDKIVENYGGMATYVVIGDPSTIVKDYELWICGTTVTDANKDDVLGDGVFTYNDAENKLTLNKSLATDPASIVIQNNIPYLTISVPKDVTLSTSTGDVITSYTDITVTGAGKLTLRSGTDSCIYMRSGATLTIENANIDAEGQWGIVGYPDGEILIIKNSDVKAAGPNGAICDFDGGITLEGCVITEPAGGKIAGANITEADGTTVAASVTITKDSSSAPTNPFVDVDSSDWFYDAVMWATTQVPPVTNGVDATHFAPNKTCTRAEVVQFLYNWAGKPAVTLTENPFVDVPADEWYYTAVLWAVENNITNGTDPTHFAPTKTCSRAEVVQFVWNYKGKPAGTADITVFKDVPADAWYASALKWAIEKKVTSGTGDGTTFSPTKKCTRAEIVQFIYKASLV